MKTAAAQCKAKMPANTATKTSDALRTSTGMCNNTRSGSGAGATAASAGAGSLAEFEERNPKRIVRVHRNALVARDAIRALEKYEGTEEAEGWVLRLHGISEPVLVSRRQLSVVRDALKEA